VGRWYFRVIAARRLPTRYCPYRREVAQTRYVREQSARPGTGVSGGRVSEGKGRGSVATPREARCRFDKRAYIQ
jgi:hypothetical protein